MLWPVTQNETPGLGARARAHACVASQRGLKKTWQAEIHGRELPKMLSSELA